MVVQVAPMSTFAETIETESEKFEESGYSTEVSQEEEDPIVIGEDVDRTSTAATPSILDERWNNKGCCVQRSCSLSG